jgi:hypothetical protein
MALGAANRSHSQRARHAGRYFFRTIDLRASLPIIDPISILGEFFRHPDMWGQ